MSLSALSHARAGGPPPVGGDWGDSPYGSLVLRGPRTLKKKPVLILDAEELAKAHLAIAMGGAEIMDTMPDPVAVPRPRQPAMMLGLAPMGAEEPDEDLSAYPAAAAAAAAAEVAEEWDEPAEEEAEIQTWTPEDEPDDWPEEDAAEFLPPVDHAIGQAEDEAAILPESGPVPPLAQQAPSAIAGSSAPSIEEQMDRMRERLARRAAATAVPEAAPEPQAAPTLAETRVPTIQRLEIDDWSQGEALRGFVPLQDRAVVPPAPQADPQSPAPQLVEPQPPTVAEDPAEPLDLMPVPTQPPVDQWQQPDDPADLLDLGANMVADGDTGHDTGDDALGAWDEHVVPVTSPPAGPTSRRASPIRERLRDSLGQPDLAPDLAPSLMARLWAWLRSRF